MSSGSKNKKIAQLLPSFESQDAMGNYVRTFSDILTKAGYENTIFARLFSKESNKNSDIKVRYYKELKEEDYDLIIFHHGIGDVVADYPKKLNIPLLVYYHNITPCEYAREYNWGLYESLRNARKQLKEFGSYAKAGMAASKYSIKELKKYGYKKTLVLPIFFETNRYANMDSYDMVADYLDKGNIVNITFVGRFSTHKDQIGIVNSFYLYQKYYNSNSRLNLLGNTKEKFYYTKVKKLVKNLDLGDKVNITGMVADGVMRTYYENSDIFLSLSEHEGFFVPVLEANYFGLPVIAYNAGAIGETAGNAAFMIDSKQPHFVASAIDNLISNIGFQNELKINGRENYKRFERSSKEQNLLEIVAEVLN